MKIWKYRSVKVAIVFAIIATLIEILLSYSLSLLVVESKLALLRNVFIILSIYLLHGAFIYLNTKTKAMAEYFVSLDLKQKLDKYTINLSYEDYYKKDYGERISIYSNDVAKVLELVLQKYLSMIEKLFAGIFIVISLFTIHYSMVILAFVSFFIMVFIPNLFQKRLSNYIQNVQTSKEKYVSKIRELLQAFDTFLENSAFSLFLSKSRIAAENYAYISLKANTFAGLMSSVLTIVNSIVTIAALSLIAYFVIEGKVEMGMFLVVSALLPSFGGAVMGFLSEREFYKSGLELYEAKFGGVDLKQFNESIFYTSIKLNEDVKNVEYNTAVETINISQIKLIDVCVTYDKQSIIFPPLLKFDKGKRYAIIGKSGSGKSSLLNVILGKLTTFSGKKEINGEVYDKSKTLFESIAYVNQHTFLFNDTVRNNIDLFGEYSDSKLIEILKRLNLENINLDTILEDNGKNISGGQRQRLAIARSLLRNKEFLIFDEATASLDPKTAVEIEKLALENAKTLIIVAHNLTEENKNKLDEIINLR